MSTIHEKNALILRKHVGTAKGEQGEEYELSSTMTGAMLVKSIKTGRTFDTSWQDVLTMAVEAGINEEPTP